MKFSGARSSRQSQRVRAIFLNTKSNNGGHRMTIERGEASAGGKAAKAGRFLGSLKDALTAASRDEVQAPADSRLKRRGHEGHTARGAGYDGRPAATSIWAGSSAALAAEYDRGRGCASRPHDAGCTFGRPPHRGRRAADDTCRARFATRASASSHAARAREAENLPRYVRPGPSGRLSGYCRRPRAWRVTRHFRR